MFIIRCIKTQRELRLTNWRFRPLWDFMYQTRRDVISEKCFHDVAIVASKGTSGVVLPSDWMQSIGLTMQTWRDTGRIQALIERSRKERKAWTEECSLCGGTGFYKGKPCPDDTCSNGEVRAFDSLYSFTMEDFSRLTDLLLDCGPIEITAEEFTDEDGEEMDLRIVTDL